MVLSAKVFPLKKTFLFSFHPWWLQIEQPLKAMVVGFLNKAVQFCNLKSFVIQLLIGRGIRALGWWKLLMLGLVVQHTGT